MTEIAGTEPEEPCLIQIEEIYDSVDQFTVISVRSNKQLGRSTEEKNMQTKFLCKSGEEFG